MQFWWPRTVDERPDIHGCKRHDAVDDLTSGLVAAFEHRDIAVSYAGECFDVLVGTEVERGCNYLIRLGGNEVFVWQVPDAEHAAAFYEDVVKYAKKFPRSDEPQPIEGLETSKLFAKTKVRNGIPHSAIALAQIKRSVVLVD